MFTYDEAFKNTVSYFNGDELAAKVCVDKYLLRDNEGNLVEKSPDDLHKRLAKEFARIEKNKYDARSYIENENELEDKFKHPLSEDFIFKLLDKFSRIIMQGSPMYGVGNPYQYISIGNCVAGNTLVYTKELGLIKMSDVKKDMHVLTHKNRFKRVIKHWSNGISPTYTIGRSFSKKPIHARTKNEMARYASMTGNHKVFTNDNKWEKVEDLKNRDYTNKKLKTPKLEYVGDVPEIFPLDFGRSIFLDEELMWIFGMYLAEGAIQIRNNKYKQVYFTLNKNEINFAKKIEKYCINILGKKCWIQHWDNYNFIQIHIYDEAFASLLDKIFSHGFDKKRIPEWMFGLDKALKESILDGFLAGDATNYKDITDEYIQFSIANPTLAYELGLLLRSINKEVRFNLNIKNNFTKSDTVTVSSSKEELITQFISSPEDVEVFDMEVEDDHSFVAGDIICHNCFVIPSPLDSYLSINYTDTQIAQISCRRGGVGWDISNLRPKGASVKNAAKTTSGSIEFMKRFSNTIREVGQHGRRGASLQTMSCYHPDILDFIKVKQDLSQVTGSNISNMFTDHFMSCVIKNKEIKLQWPIDSDNPKIVKNIMAQDIWKEFIHSAWKTSEPGACFIDAVHRESPGYHYGQKEVSANPCGEQYLPPYASCRLLLVNLMGYIKSAFTNKAEFDYDFFRKDVMILQRLGDDLVDLEIECIDKIINKIKSDPEPNYIKQPGIDLWENIKRVALIDRRTGCGFTGLGDCLAALNIKYGTKKSIDFVENMQKTYALAAYKSSVEMAKVLGPFPDYDAKIDIKSDFIKRISETDPILYKDMKKYGRRNMVLLTVAPTGSVSCLSQTTSGLEPVFALEYTRRKKGNPGDKDFKSDFIDQSGDHWMHFNVKHKGLQNWLDKNPDKKEEDSPYWGCSSGEIDWINRVKLQAALQKWIDNSISSTINLPSDITEEKVSEIYIEAWKSGCKGMTIYRDGSRTGVLVNNIESSVLNDAPKRPKEILCDVHHITRDKTPYFVLVGKLNNSPYEIFAGQNHNHVLDNKIKSGKIIKNGRGKYKFLSDDSETELSPISAFVDLSEEAVTRLISTSLRHGIKLEFITHQLEKTKGNMQSLSKCLARALKNYIVDGTEVKGEECPECNGKLIRVEGCINCKNCGYSKC